MAKIRSWEVSDEFWKRVEPLIPKREREPSKPFRRKPGGGRKPMSERRSVRGYRFCTQDGLPVEVIAQGTVRECKLGAQVLSAVAQNGALPRPLACRSCRIRRDGGDRLEMAEHRRCHDQSASRTGSNRSEPNRPGEKGEASGIFRWTAVASRCR